jgi:hypothetical protein
VSDGAKTSLGVVRRIITSYLVADASVSIDLMKGRKAPETKGRSQAAELNAHQCDPSY